MQKEIRNQEQKEQDLQDVKEKIYNEDYIARESQEFIKEREIYQKHLLDKKEALLKQTEEAQHRQETIVHARDAKNRNFSPEVGKSLGPSINHNYGYMPKGQRNIPDYEKENRQEINDPNFYKEFDEYVNKDKYGNSSNYYKEIEKYHNHQPLLPHGPKNTNISNVRGVNNIYNTLDMNTNHHSDMQQKNDNQATKKVNFVSGEPIENNSDMNKELNKPMEVDPRPQEICKHRLKVPMNYKPKFPGVQTINMRPTETNDVNYPDYFRGQIGSEFTLDNIANKDIQDLNDSYEKIIRQQDLIKNPIGSNDLISKDIISGISKINPKYQYVDNNWQNFYNKTDNPQFTRQKRGHIMM